MPLCFIECPVDPEMVVERHRQSRPPVCYANALSVRLLGDDISMSCSRLAC